MQVYSLCSKSLFLTSSFMIPSVSFPPFPQSTRLMLRVETPFDLDPRAPLRSRSNIYPFEDAFAGSSGRKLFPLFSAIMDSHFSSISSED